MKRKFLALGLLPFSLLHAFPVANQVFGKKAKKTQIEEPACQAGIELEAQFLYWFAKPTNFPYGVTNLSVARAPGDPIAEIAPSKLNYFDVSWDPGARVSAAMLFPERQWDLTARWTYYRTKRSESLSVPAFSSSIPGVGGKSLINPWIFNSAFATPYFASISGKWDLYLNYFDLQFGKTVCFANKVFELRTYVGAAGGWTKSHFRTVTDGEEPDFQVEEIRTRFREKFWGAGLSAGLKPQFNITKNFTLFGGLDLALLWGRFNNKKKESDFLVDSSGAIVADFTLNAKDVFFAMQPILALNAGLKWSTRFYKDCYGFFASLGWESQFWFNQYHYFQTYQRIIVDNHRAYNNLSVSTGDLLLSGGFASAGFEF